MTPPNLKDQPKEQTTLAQALLQRAHEQSAESPERSPFWREGPWRCEYYRSGGPERLKVFSGDACVHEEPVQDQSADRRARELKRVFAESQRAGRDHTLLR